MNMKPLLQTLIVVTAGLTSIASQATTSVFNTDVPVLIQLIENAVINDKKRSEITAQTQATLENSVAASSLPDPKLKMGFGGLPIDSFSFDSDPMTMLSVGLMQQFGRGATLDLQQRKGEIQAKGIELQLGVRELDIANAITQRWLELGYLQHVEAIIKQNKRLFSELAQVTKTNYANGTNEAQDVLQAELQISKMDETLNSNLQQQQRLIYQLSEWLGTQWLSSAGTMNAKQPLHWQKLNTLLPQLENRTEHYAILRHHPMVKISDTAISANETQVDIAAEAYKPQFGVEVMYGARFANGMNGKPASDMLSAYLTMDVPLFTENKQDRSYNAAQQQVIAAKSQRDLLLQQMNAKVNTLLIERHNLLSRIERYKKSLQPQAKARTQAVERGYQNNTASFKDVITAANDELNLNTERVRIETDLQLTNSQLAALTNGFDIQPSTLTNNNNQ
ncbi:TolC family protein [Photobacterium leiognathi]|uniref:TolC family protein n=1 Tax=Photobacterium leiognathi TaxID=553611 RepID=UPI0002088179|nr:TolC family protein [Photobacterium leiognathi]PSW52075.1 TolC family protein [Photobacterium leiognathi subsp. mandapamensis]GAA04398.1 outer membrane efflux family protein [Photobacterium leiognathi subsp. mandapamensis svers.1.1.]